MHGFERDGWDVDQVQVTVHSAVEAEVAEVRRHAVEIMGVVAEYRYGNAAGLLFVLSRGRVTDLCGLEEVGDIDYEFIVAAGVFACEIFADVDGCCLACAFKVQQRTAICVGVGDGDMGAVPAVATIVGCVRIAGVPGVEAMRHGDGLPFGQFFAVPYLPWPVQRSLYVLPSFSETVGVSSARGIGRTGSQCGDRGAQDGIRQQGERRSRGAGL